MATTQLTAIRAEMRQDGLSALLVPRSDEHLGEYVPASAERLAWLSGFSGSAGLAVVLADQACLFTDGRYITQAGLQLDRSDWGVRHITDDPPAAWLAGLGEAAVASVGYDPLLLSQESLTRFTEAGCVMVPTARNLVDAAWSGRPPPPLAPARVHGLEFAGASSAEKREQVAATLRTARQDAAVLTDPASIGWLLNLRGADVPFTPFVLGFAILRADETLDLFMPPEKLTAEVRDWLGNGVRTRPREQLAPALAEFAGRRVRVDAAGAPVWFAQRLRDAGATVVEAGDPCLLPKACKNPTEREGARLAHRRDAGAMCRFLHWLDGTAEALDEWRVAQRRLAFRQQLPDFRGESFPAIAGAGEHGAIMHYRVDPADPRALQPNEVFLIDSGAQFGCGTTDVTRTVWRGPDPAPDRLRDQATRVLRGHIALATLQFPRGTHGGHIDAFARRALWDVGLDYDHGTGHGVGSYLSVHEGPVSLSKLARPVALAAGMILSNEPGFYLPGEYGMRLENLMLVADAEPKAERPFLRFETLTLVPFDRKLLDPAALDRVECDWLDAYHARVLREIGPDLPDDVRSWLQAACAPMRV